MFFPMGVLRSWRIQFPPTNVKGEHYVAHLRLSAPPEKESTSQHIFFSDCLPLFHFIGGSALDITLFMAGNGSHLVKC